MNSDKLSVIFFNLFIISFPLSITLSQSFAILSGFSFLHSSYISKNLLVTFKNRAYISSILIYLALIPSFLWNLPKYDNSILSIISKSEISDFWMCFLVLPAFYHVRNLEYRKYILVSIYIASFIVVLSGFISIFTPFRLAPFISEGFQVKEGVRLQHFAGDFWGRYTFLPIGLMNTHLTFGGLCGLFFPGLLVHLSMTYRERKWWKNLFLFFFIAIFIVVLFFNQSRSVWLGIVFALGLIGFKLIQVVEIKKTLFRWKTFYVLIGILFLIGITSLSIYNKNWLLQRAFQEGLADNTTENQRYFIYKNTLNILKKHWHIGIGPGRFDLEHQLESNQMIHANEQLWYEIFITPRQHSHHDLLHFFTIGGIFGLLAYLHFWFYLFRLFIKSPSTSQTILFSGIFTLFISGFFQCFLLDDEVALPFFAMIGLFAGSLQKEDGRTKVIAGIRARRELNPKDSFQVESLTFGIDFSYLKRQLELRGKEFPYKKIILHAIITILIPISISLFYIFYKTRLEPIDVYKRKVTINYPEDKVLIFKSLNGKSVLYPTSHMQESDFIKIEGCLTHRFTNPISIRKNKYQFILSFPESIQNPPKNVMISVLERDAFDQDKLYKIHKSRKIGNEYIYPITLHGKTIVTIEDMELFVNIKESNKFPENIFFRDFKFHFSGFDTSREYFDLPSIDFGNLCDAK